MNKFTHKELGLVSLFEDISTKSDMQDWIRMVDKLPVARAALVMREVLVHKVDGPGEVQDLREKLEDVSKALREAEGLAYESEGWAGK